MRMWKQLRRKMIKWRLSNILNKKFIARALIFVQLLNVVIVGQELLFGRFKELHHCKYQTDENRHLLVNCLLYSTLYRTTILTSNAEVIVILNVTMKSVLDVDHAKVNLDNSAELRLRLRNVNLTKLRINPFSDLSEMNLIDGEEIYKTRLTEISDTFDSLEIDMTFPQEKIVAVAVRQKSGNDVRSAGWRTVLLDPIISDTFISELDLRKANYDLFSVSFYPGISVPEYLSSKLNELQGLRIYKYVIHDSEFANLTRECLPELPHLYHLGFPNCKLKLIEEGALMNVFTVTELDLHGNDFASIPDAIYSLQSLKSVNLADNYLLHEFELSAGTKNNSINILNLSGTKIEFQNNFTFLDFPGLEVINMTRCFIEDIPEYVFQNNSVPKIIDLSYNLLKDIHPHTFQNMTSLKILKLDHNRITTMDFLSVFSHSTSLEIVDLSYNAILQLVPEVTGLNSTIKVLILNNNKIRPWSWPLSKKLDVLNMEENNVAFITREMMADILSGKNIDLRNNPFACTYCNLSDFFTLKETIENSDKYVCETPVNFKGVLLVEFLNSDECLIAFFDWQIKVILPLVGVLFFTTLSIVLACHFRWYLRYILFLCRAKVHAFRNKTIDSRASFLFDAFVSYSSDDISWIIGEFLPYVEDQAKFKLCLHDRNFLPGEEITVNIIQSISCSRKVIAVLSDNYVQSKWCMMELHLSQHRLHEENRDSLIVVKLPNLKTQNMNKNVKYLLKTRTYLEWSDDPEAKHYFWLKLKKILKSSTRSSRSKQRNFEPLQMEQ